MELKAFSRSLTDLLGDEYIDAVCEATAFCTGEDAASLRKLARRPVDFWTAEHTGRMNELVGSVGTVVCRQFASSAVGVGSASFVGATKVYSAPLSGFGCVRVGEDGRAYFLGKSEHYHVSLGHKFPGFRLLDVARVVGILHPEHNNMRGHITRLLEERLIAAANGLEPDDTAGLEAIRSSHEPHVLNRIINLQTGSLVAEAAMKMMLARFFRLQSHLPAPQYHGKRPVIFVLGDNSSGLQANYHGTTLVTQMLRGLWPDLRRAIEDQIHIVPLPINDTAAFNSLVEKHDCGDSKVAGLFHEFVLMNYGCIQLEKSYVKNLYDVCSRRDIPIAADEIQSGAWSADAFLFREYDVTPDIVALGKGFPGGEYAASRIMLTSAMDNLDQFGALVTNGQEEIASLSYLIVMEAIRENGEFITEMGTYYRNELESLVKDYPSLITKIEGVRHMASIYFTDPELAEAFSRLMNKRCIDISTHSYKVESLPAALTKLPVIANSFAIDYVIGAMRQVIESL